MSPRGATHLSRVAAGCAILAFGGAAAAQERWDLRGSLDPICMISFDCQAGDRCMQLRLDDRSTDQDTAVITWRCNFAVDAASLEFSSENQGTLRNPEDEIALPYRASYTGALNSGFADQSLVTPVRTSPNVDAANVDVSGILRVRIAARTESLFAGRYTDRVTVTITPNSR